VDEQRKQSVITGFGVYSIAEVWEWQRQLNRPVKNDNSVMSISIVTFVLAVE
jgi:hypothetical protein